MGSKDELMELASVIVKNDWDEQNIVQHKKWSITQFHGTAFDSDYKCYKLLWKEWPRNGLAVMSPRIIRSYVAKITNVTEDLALQILYEEGLPVPRMEAIIRFNGGRIMIFMELLSGSELYSNTDRNAWKDAAKKLAEIHNRFWAGKHKEDRRLNALSVNRAVLERIQNATNNAASKESWHKYMQTVQTRLATAPKTLIHGDLFPTNIMVDNGCASFIDWANAGVFAYMMDLGRLTAIIDQKTLAPMCPCEDVVLKEYYRMMQDALQISYDEFLADVHMAQFIELANYYTPWRCFGVNDVYNQLTAKKLDEIVAAHHY